MAKTLWNIIPKDYKSIIQGKKYVMVRKTKGSTLVKFSDPSVKKQWGKY